MFKSKRSRDHCRGGLLESAMRLTDMGFRYPECWCRENGGSGAGRGKGRLWCQGQERKIVIIMLNEGSSPTQMANY